MPLCTEGWTPLTITSGDSTTAKCLVWVYGNAAEPHETFRDAYALCGDLGATILQPESTEELVSNSDYMQLT